MTSPTFLPGRVSSHPISSHPTPSHPVPKALVEFETIWHAAWLKARLGGSAPDREPRCTPAERSRQRMSLPHRPSGRPVLCARTRSALNSCFLPSPHQGIDAQKAGLSAPLLVRHPDSGQLLVNLDRDVVTLIR